MKSFDVASGTDLLGMLTAATNWLEQNAVYIDSLNVFPVPDGDTGTNMLLSMRSALEEARAVSEYTASAVAEAFARGGLIGARGNSGIILSQFWQGLAQGIKGKKSIRATDLTKSLQTASLLSFQALSKPVEGTILTVIKDIAAVAQQSSVVEEDLVSLMERVVKTAKRSVARTQMQLQVLKEAGVVDAGGQGLHIILEGALKYFRNNRVDSLQTSPPVTASVTAHSLPRIVSNGSPYGFCTEFILRGENLEPDKIRIVLENRGESLVVAGNTRIVRVHIHTLKPSSVVRYAESFGQVDHLSIRNMDEQHEAYLQGWKEKRQQGAVTVLAVVPGQGFAEVFSSLGSKTVVIDTKEPKQWIEDLRDALEELKDSRVFILPNSMDLFPVAEEIRTSLKKQVTIVPTKTIPQGVSAVLAFNHEEDSELNRRLMELAIEQIHTIEIYRTAHHDGQVVGLLEGEAAERGKDAREVLEKIMTRLNVDKAELVTVYYSDGISTETVEAICSTLQRDYPHLEVETISSGYFSSDFIISIE